MLDLTYKKTKDGWGQKAVFANLEFTFSGTFDPGRINNEKTKDFLDRFSKAVLWVIIFAGLGALSMSVREAVKSDTPLFFLEHSPFQLITWTSLFCSLYLWAKIKQNQADGELLNVLHLEADGPKAKKRILDVYQLFNGQAKTAWNKSLFVAHDRNKDASEPSANDLFLSLLNDSQIQLIFSRLGISTEGLKTFLTNHLRSLPKTAAKNELIQIPFLALTESVKLHNKTIDPLMLLCGLFAALPAEHIIKNIFFNINVDLEKLETVSAWIFTVQILAEDLKLFHKLARFKPNNEINQGLTSVPTPYLDRFSTDLTSQAKHGRLPLAWGRKQSLKELFTHLSEGSQNIVIKGGEGTGRTTLVNELAYSMVTEQVPKILQDKRLIKLELSGILGTAGKAEAVLIHALEEAVRSGNIILVIEDIHTLAKTNTSEGLSLLELLVNFLNQSSLQVFGTTTLDDEVDYLRKAANFNQIFTAYELPPLTPGEILLASCVRASILEFRNKCFFRYPAIEQAVELSNSYIMEGGQPQKTISLLVEAATRAKNGASGTQVVTAQLIQSIVSEKTHIPAETLNQDESDKLLGLEQDLAKSVIGQAEAITAVSEALRRARSGLASTDRPFASFLFVGPTGVGKTELAKTLASSYFGKEQYLLRLDMSEYRGADGLSKLLGTNSENTDTPLVKHLKTYPFCLLLCDEFEKASPEVWNLFLQILEDGRLTTGKGETMNLTHTMVIATSNAGTKDIQAGLKAGKTAEKIKSEIFSNILTGIFPPELLNRFDGIILFNPLSPEEVERITRLQLEHLTAQLMAKGIKLEFAPAVVRDISVNAFDPLLGARPIRRYIQDHVEGFIAKLILAKKLTRGSQATINLTKAGLVIE